MKKIFYLLIVITALVPFTSCSKENLSEVIDVDPESLSIMNEYEKQLYIEACNRVNVYVVLLNNQYYLNINSGKEIKISERLFQHFKALIE